MARTIGGDYPYKKHEEIKKFIAKRGGTVGGGFTAPRRMTAQAVPPPVAGTTRATGTVGGEPLRRARKKTLGGF